jgi:hypothetical protein
MASKEYLEAQLRDTENTIETLRSDSLRYQNANTDLVIKVTQFLLLGCIGFLAAGFAWISQSEEIVVTELYFCVFVIASAIFLICGVLVFLIFLGLTISNQIEHDRARSLLDHYRLQKFYLSSVIFAGITDDKTIKEQRTRFGLDDYKEYEEPKFKGTMWLIRNLGKFWSKSILIVGTVFLSGIVTFGISLTLYFLSG